MKKILIIAMCFINFKVMHAMESIKPITPPPTVIKQAPKEVLSTKIEIPVIVVKRLGEKLNKKNKKPLLIKLTAIKDYKNNGKHVTSCPDVWQLTIRLSQ